MMIKLSIHLTIACLIGAPLILVVAKISGNAHGRISEKVQDLSAESSEIAEETIQTVRTVRSFGNEDGELKRFADILRQAYRASLIQAALSAGQKWFVEVGRHRSCARSSCSRSVSSTRNECRHVVLRSKVGP